MSRTIVVQPVLYTGKSGVDGDYLWMVKQAQYQNTLFIIMENFLDSISDDQPKGSGTACLRRFTLKAMSASDIQAGKIPRAAGFPSGWSVNTGGFRVLDKKSQLAIDLSFERILGILHKHPSIDRVVYSCDDDDPEVARRTVAHAESYEEDEDGLC